MDDQILQRVTVNPQVMAGKPVIRGTRIPVELIVRMLAQGISEADILREYPRFLYGLKSEQILIFPILF